MSFDDFRHYRQADGDVIIGGPMNQDADEVRVPRADVLTLLGVVLTAIRVHGTDETVEIARKKCKAHLGGM